MTDLTHEPTDLEIGLAIHEEREAERNGKTPPARPQHSLDANKDLIIGPFVLTPIGMRVIPGIQVTLSEYAKAEEVMHGLHNSVQWARGDLYNFGELNFENEMAQLYDPFRYTLESLQNLAWIARVFPMSERNDKLTHSHHVAVAPLASPDQRRAMLAVALRDGLSVRELREQVRLLLHPPEDDPDEDDDDDGSNVVSRELVRLDAPDDMTDFISPDGTLMVALPLSEINIEDIKAAQQNGARLRFVIVEEMES